MAPNALSKYKEETKESDSFWLQFKLCIFIHRVHVEFQSDQSNCFDDKYEGFKGDQTWTPQN